MARLTLYRGATYSEELSLGMDLTGATVYFTVKPDFDSDVTDAAAIIQKNLTSHVDPVGGKTLLTLTSADTDKEPNEYVFDVHVKKSDGTVVVFKPETFTIKPVVTLRS